jgi:cyanate permease
MIDLSNRWVVLGLLFLVGLTSPVQFQSVAALAPYLIESRGLTYTDIGILSGLFMAPGIFLAAPSGLVAARIGDRLTLVVGSVLMAGSAIVFALTDSYAVMLTCRLVGGAGSVAVGVLLPKLVTDWFAGKEIATAMSIIASSVGFGIGLTMAVLPLIAAPTSWRFAMLATAVGSVAAVLLLLLVYRDEAPGGQSHEGLSIWRISRPEAILSSLAGIGRGLFSAGYFVFMSFLPALLIARGVPAVEAGLLISISALVSLASVPLGGYLSDRTGKPNHFIVGGSVTTALTCVLVPYVPPPLLWVVLFGAVRGAVTGGLMSLPSHVLRPQSRNTGFALVSATYFICMAVLPPAAGYLLDATGNPEVPLWFAGVLWLLISVLLAAFLALKRRWID